MTILVIRHGETPGNRSRTVQMPDTPLSDTGKQQAALLAKRLASHNITGILCSDYLRARQTAEPLCNLLDLAADFTPILRERNFGDLRGRRYEEIGEDFFAPDYVPANGESWAAFDQRVQLAWQGILSQAQQTGGNIAIITHGLVCLRLVSNHTLTSEECAIPTHWGNTSVTQIASSPPHEVSLLNCTEHLLNADLHTTSSGRV